MGYAKIYSVYKNLVNSLWKIFKKVTVLIWRNIICVLRLRACFILVHMCFRVFLVDARWNIVKLHKSSGISVWSRKSLLKNAWFQWPNFAIFWYITTRILIQNVFISP